ncbi:MAG: glycine/sarcosine/betaine reductase selenoprotein B family protein [Actinomycetota bacterium]|nr:glycine/sarcosine/betaine reductase selenoprotein B family protein [Actinomycetota bacterium]
MNGDQAMREMGKNLPVPEFEHTPFTTPQSLRKATVAIVTSAALHCADDERFSPADTGYRVIPADARDLVMGHWSPNFDHTGFQMDIDVVFPIDRLVELQADGVIGRVAPRHFSFAGNQPDDVATIRLDSGPRAAAELKRDGVDVVILTPV